MKRLLAATALIGFALLVAACDNFVGYTVINDTSENLRAWVFFNDCEGTAGYRDEYDYHRDIRAGSKVEVFDATGALPNGDWCLQVVDSDRRLVLTASFSSAEYDPVVRLNEPLTRGPTIPQESELPERPFPGAIWREFTIAPVQWIFAAVVFAGIVYGSIVGLSWRWKNLRADPPLN